MASLGSGLSRGFLNARALKLQKEELRDKATQAARKQRQDTLKAAADAVTTAVDESIPFLTEAVKNGNPADPEFSAQFQQILAAVTRPIEMHAQMLNGINDEVLRAVESGEAPQEVMQVLPDADAFREQQMAKISAALFPAMMNNPGSRGTADARETLARVETLLGRDLEPQEREQLAGVEGAVPDVINLLNPDSGEVLGIDRNAPNASQQVSRLLSQGFIETGLNLQTDDPSTLKPDKALNMFIEQEVAVRDVLSEIDRLKTQLGDSDIRTSLAGGLIRGLDTAADQIIQIGESAGLIDPGLSSADYDLSGFGSEAQSSAAFRSNVINLSVMLARAAEPGARLSDPDVQRQINRLEASGSRIQMSAALDEVSRATKSTLKNRHQTLQRVGIPVPGFPQDLDPDSGTGNPVDELLNLSPDQWTREQLENLTPAQRAELARRVGE